MKKIKFFEEFVNENKTNKEEDWKYKDTMPSEFTGDPEKDPYIRATIYDEENKLQLNFSYRKDGKLPNEFNPYKKAQKEGNEYNKIWNSLVNWVKTNPEFSNFSVLEKDKCLLRAFKHVLKNQKSLASVEEIKKQGWKVFNYNRCKQKWENLVKLSKKAYPSDKEGNERIKLVKKNFEQFIQDEGIYKYAKSWIPEFSRTYPVKDK